MKRNKSTTIIDVGGRHTKFKLALAAIIIIIIGTLYSLHIIPHRSYTNADFGIEPYLSTNDQDHDGIDDQTDILQSARDYLTTRPKYASKYYSTGYPDDEYGVCTDVIAQALLGAGYDLMTLVAQDVKAHPDKYDIDTPDQNIDFRRVKNLAIFFQNHAQSLATNINQINEWQGGDIVIFKDHIGIISDRRNHNGVPFLIHHYSPLQVTYEEDTLPWYQTEIIGHYRVTQPL